MEMYHCFFVYLSLLNNVEWNQIIFLEGNGSQISAKRILVQFVVVCFLKGQEPFHHLQMKQEEIKLLSSEARLASAEHKPDPPQKLYSHCCVFMLNLQRLVPWQGWGLRQGLGKTQLKASGSRWASWSLLSLSRHRVRLSKSPVSAGPDMTRVTTSVTDLLCVTRASGSSLGSFPSWSLEEGLFLGQLYLPARKIIDWGKQSA